MLSNKHELTILTYLNNKSISETAKSLGYTEFTVYKILRNNKISLFKLDNKEDYDNIVKLYKNNYSCAEIGKLYNCSHEKIRYILKKKKEFIPKYIRSKINIDFLLNPSQERNYFFGLLFSDGYIDYLNGDVYIKLKSEDSKILENLSKLIGENLIINRSKEKKNWIIKNGEKKHFTSSSSATLKFRSKEFTNYLQSIGLLPNKTETLVIPEQFKHDSHFWRGMIDGDGCIYFKNNTLQLTLVGTKDVCESFLNYCLKIQPNIHSKIRKSGKIYTVRITSSKALKILEFLYKRSTISLDRKHKKYIEVLEKYKPNLKYLELTD